MYDQRKTILVIDDNLSTLFSLQSILEGKYELSLAKDAKIAQTILSVARVDLILLDMEMPGLSGMEFLELLHSNPSLYDIPVIIVSSHGTADIIINARKLGAVDFVVKPISSEALLDKIHIALRDAPEKISKLGLLRKLQVRESASIKGQRNQVETIIDDLEHFSYDIETDPELAALCKAARKMEYNDVVEKTNKLLMQLS